MLFAPSYQKPCVQKRVPNLARVTCSILEVVLSFVFSMCGCDILYAFTAKSLDFVWTLTCSPATKIWLSCVIVSWCAGCRADRVATVTSDVIDKIVGLQNSDGECPNPEGL